MNQKLKRKSIYSKNNKYEETGFLPARNKGMTLVALIITIIVLLILVVVVIGAVTGNKMLNYASNARSQYSGSQINEHTQLGEYLEKLDRENSKINNVARVKDNLNKVLSTSENIVLIDDFGNKIKVPAGFKIIVDNTTNYTADDIDITKGIVVEDTQLETAGNQFVWIPVGKIYTDTEKTEENAKTITLGRYENFTKTNGEYTVAQNANEYEKIIPINNGSYNYTEYTTPQSNVIAQNIGEFCTKTNASGGYYIGRYEARVGTETERKSKNDELAQVTLKADNYVYNYVTQPQASERCQTMYTNKPFESDLANGYAWDTAIIFFQEFGDNAAYASKKSVNNYLAVTGTSGTIYTGEVDVICNVYDMGSNCYEWSTETSSFSESPSNKRGGFCYNASYYTSIRRSNKTYDAYDNLGFRPVLYM